MGIMRVPSSISATANDTINRFCSTGLSCLSFATAMITIRFPNIINSIMIPTMIPSAMEEAVRCGCIATTLCTVVSVPVLLHKAPHGTAGSVVLAAMSVVVTSDSYSSYSFAFPSYFSKSASCKCRISKTEKI